ncbi:MAG TPA: DUF86 domain-containing protein [Candidatus Accumulibacter sp.]|nr:MAG: hypothetical protein AW07_03671 [Candidatus Accumulibacter sp. SK-11]HAY29876.1 DUF86 domain-containing protein [Accumulibacter sp.]HCN69738.1 DUF86 domain-containing protein [Accumulibacter sp.]
MSPHDRWRLQHMIEAAESTQKFIAGRERADLDRDQMLVFAIVRAVEIIGEAASKISEETRISHPAIPWKAIIGMRNRLVHAYFDIDASIVWVAVTEEIPALLRQLKTLAASEHDG